MEIENVSVRNWKHPSAESRNRFYLEAANAISRLPSANKLEQRDGELYLRALLRKNGLGYEDKPSVEEVKKATIKALSAERRLSARTTGELRKAHAFLATYLGRLPEQKKTA